MKKIIYLLLAVLLFCLQSCVKDEKDLFDLPAAERINAKLQEYSKILQDAPNGWKMEYFPEIKQSMGGYTYFCTFQNGETVMMGGLVTHLSRSRLVSGRYGNNLGIQTNIRSRARIEF